ncbi:hypothetical protein UFOVP459_73 [uncultured Caudovirales phage]|uniref:Uncharacterized protein n=1 Tax=uncultured Caudovirales phage TaxID=2100421 RepID=A0A6J5MDV4_9CAUD|nr:hypothetical protein UFOVP459_73 [uncultured Caudovirales phage]CAB4182622.1 hypothetical protein UFOVP1089_12 [uncultured Caudovirales phage]CAB4212670.1 hypothetical protein UFOVP1443_31 [uncultured Caudovirales phage]
MVGHLISLLHIGQYLKNFGLSCSSNEKIFSPHLGTYLIRPNSLNIFFISVHSQNSTSSYSSNSGIGSQWVGLKNAPTVSDQIFSCSWKNANFEIFRLFTITHVPSFGAVSIGNHLSFIFNLNDMPTTIRAEFESTIV